LLQIDAFMSSENLAINPGYPTSMFRPSANNKVGRDPLPNVSIILYLDGTAIDSKGCHLELIPYHSSQHHCSLRKYVEIAMLSTSLAISLTLSADDQPQ
jgi:hypothetical protein